MCENTKENNMTNNIFEHPKANSSISLDEMIVSITQKAFTNKNKLTTEKLFDEVHQLAYSNYFSPEGGEFIDFDIIDINDITDYEVQQNGAYVQVARAFSGNPKEQEIKNNILNSGFKLKCLPIEVQILGDETYRIINGRTRLKILKELGFTNVIVSIFRFEKDSDYLTQQIRRNTENEPQGNALMRDVVATGQTMIKEGFINKNSLTFRTDVASWVKRAVVKGSFTPGILDTIATTIVNNVSERDFVASWDQSSIYKWMNTHGYRKVDSKRNPSLYESTKEDDDYLYYVVSHTTSTKNVVLSAKILCKSEYEDRNIRLIVHTGTLPADINFEDLPKKFNEYVENHTNAFKTHLREIRDVCFVSTPKDQSAIKDSKRVVCFGALPTLKNKHDMDKFVSV